MRLVKKAKQEWRDLFGDLYDILHSSGDRTIEVDISSSDTLTDDIMNLRYFFPLAYRLVETKVITVSAPLILNILLAPAGGNVPAEYLSRTETFLSQARNLPYIKSLVNGTPLSQPLGVPGRLFPLCQVYRSGASSAHNDYRTLAECLYDKGRGENVSRQNTPPFVDIANKLLQRVKSQENYKGLRGVSRSFDTFDKEKLQVQVNEYLNEHLGTMSILAQIIWLFILRELQESKQLYSLPKRNEDSPHIYENVLSKSRMDAIVYSEGMQQLIENACLHSCGHTAWFGFRMYQASRKPSMSKLVEETRTRVKLYETYSPCFRQSSRTSSQNVFNEDYDFYFEFFVLDDAGDHAGMTEQYNQKVFEENQDIVLPVYQNKLSEDERLSFQPPRQFADVLPYRESWMESACAAAQAQEIRLYVTKLSQLLELPVRRENLESHLEDLTIHYGLRLLRRIVSVNHGYLMGSSPCGENTTLYYLNGNTEGDKGESEPKSSYVTEWKAILPITYQWNKVAENASVVNGPNCFGEKISPPRKTLYFISQSELLGNISARKKDDDISALREFLKGRLSALTTEEINLSVLLVQMEQITLYDLEVISKSLFAEIVRIIWEKEKAEPRIALVFSAPEAIHEFVRLFSVFYLKSEQPDMKRVQIALCTGNTRYNGIYDVEFMLAGSSLGSTYENALLFAYHHSENTLAYLPLLDYLTKSENTTEDPAESSLPLFPFELCLPPVLPNSPVQKLDWQHNWFIQRMNAVLQKDLRDSAYGCMIDDIHIRLSSKLHLGRFYEAELLFHNMGNVARFAYMIAQELLYGDSIETLVKDGQILLLGYEKYAAALLLQVEYWLNKAGCFDGVYMAIIYDGEDESHVELRPYFDMESERCPCPKQVQPVTILPVGTTLSTIYKMHNTARRSLGSWFHGLWDEQAQNRNICLILANRDLCGTGDLNAITYRYWSDVDRGRQIVTVNREKVASKEVQVKYLLGADVEWMDPQDCAICRKVGEDIRPIIGGKQSDTIPSAIFLLHADRGGRFRDLLDESHLKENEKRICALLGNISYSHIYHGNNHFQFYLYFQKIYLENQNDIHKDLRKYRVKQDGFHVVISPLQLSNSTFVKAVIDEAFNGNARFLYVDLSNAYREEIRTKFSYISEEYRCIQRNNPNTKFYIHFVDTSIVTGSRLNRARLFMQMLLQQSHICSKDVQLFERVFLLVNRCSYDSANYFTKEPRENLYAYIHLAIPSYNTENDFCPACKLTAKYELLGKRSSTERLSGEFQRLQEKHGKRTSHEYARWLNEAMQKNRTYFSWLKQWLYVNVSHSQKRLLSFAPEAAQKRSDRLGTAAMDAEYETACRIIKDLDDYREISGVWDRSENLWGVELDDDQHKARQVYLHSLGGGNLDEVVRHLNANGRGSTLLSDALAIIRTHLIAVRDYMRLTALQHSYEALDGIPDTLGTTPYSSCRAAMLKLMAKSLVLDSSNIDSTLKGQLKRVSSTEQYRFLLAYSSEWLISYIKVLSRSQVANYYNYRQAITGIMSDMLRILSKPSYYENCIKEMQAEQEKTSGTKLPTKYWERIVRFLGILRGYEKEQSEPQLRAQLCYQVHMTLVHRMADLQITSRIDADSVISTMDLYHSLVCMYFSQKPGFPYIDLPDSEQLTMRYLKSVKAATMTSNDDIPCLILTATPADLIHRIEGRSRYAAYIRENLLLCARYIYMENTRMLYSGMRDMEKQISPDVLSQVERYRPADSFSTYMGILSEEVDCCLRSCYRNLDETAKEEDILYQNLLGNFCRFWHQSTGEAPVGTGGGINPLAYMLQYFRRLSRMSSDKDNTIDLDEIPYFYEELCRCICGFTGFQMCYIAYQSAGNVPEVFTQSGYQISLMEHDLLLTASQIGAIIRRAFAQSPDNPNIVIPGVAKLLGEESCDYLVLHIPLKGNTPSNHGFYLILQADKNKNIFRHENRALPRQTLRKARDILFLRRRLQEVLMRDYTVLINLRFDCSYVRTFYKGAQNHPCIMHISDLHVKEDMGDRSADICKRMLGALEKCQLKNSSGPDEQVKIDLLVISGDIVDSRDANAPRMEQNYRHAEKLLNAIVSVLWKDADGYLPHDWRRRIIITTGNHDYASMNQYQAAQKQRTLTFAVPAEGESGTMSKFAYFIDFLIRYLDPPVDELLRNDLNETRFYRKLNFKVLVLNCSGAANPLRTNKIGVHEERVLDLLSREAWSGNQSENGQRVFRLVIGHYSPRYELSYFIDSYSVLPGWVWGQEKRGIDWLRNNQLTRTINDLVEIFEKAIEEEVTANGVETEPLKEIRATFISEFSNLTKAMEIFISENLSAPSTAVDAYLICLRTMFHEDAHRDGAGKKSLVTQLEENDLFKRIRHYYTWLCGSKKWDEHISKLFYEVNESIRMSSSDKFSFRQFIEKIQENNKFDLYLAGHVHAYAEDPQQHILVADKLFGGDRKDIRGYIIQAQLGDDISYTSERFK